ncbi:MAG: glycosyltransferase family 2 protein, partial [Dehalococcoidia bacterium]|nr:glycosyltransferase family 2 protein [Dehalococcoidia bacterium]
RIVKNDRNYGFAEGCNIGIRDALSRGADYVLLLNNDTTVAPDFLSIMVDAAEKDEKIGLLAPVIYYYNEPEVVWEAGGSVNWWLGGIRMNTQLKAVCDRDAIVDTGLLSGAAMLITRGLLEKISLLNSSFFFGFEDYDFCIRAHKAGYRVVLVPGARIWHKVGRARGKLSEHPETRAKVLSAQGLFEIKLRCKLFRKHAVMPPYPIPIVMYFLVYWPMTGARLLLRGDFAVLWRRIKGIVRDLYNLRASAS